MYSAARVAIRGMYSYSPHILRRMGRQPPQGFTRNHIYMNIPLTLVEAIHETTCAMEHAACLSAGKFQ